MDAQILIAVGFIVIPILFNLFFGILASIFEYPEILRKSTSEVLSKFSAGGDRLVLTWWAFMLTAVVFVPISISLPAIMKSDLMVLNSLVFGFGLIAGLVQFVGLSRWAFLVPYLARESSGADKQRIGTIDLIFQSANRFLGVAVGEHLGYLFTGMWSISSGILMIYVENSNQIIGFLGIIIGALLMLCSLEFVGKNVEKGWNVAAAITPFVYIAWSLWLIGIGLDLLFFK